MSTENVTARGLTARDVMATAVITTAPDEPVGVAAERMAHHRLGALPVVASDGAVLGLMTSNDIVWLRAGEMPAIEAPTQGPEPGDSAPADAAYWYHLGVAEARRRLHDRCEPGPETTVSSIYSPGAIAVEPRTPLAEVARLMAIHRIHHVLVLERGRLAGLVSALDVVRAMAPGGSA